MRNHAWAYFKGDFVELYMRMHNYAKSYKYFRNYIYRISFYPGMQHESPLFHAQTLLNDLTHFFKEEQNKEILFPKRKCIDFIDNGL